MVFAFVLLSVLASFADMASYTYDKTNRLIQANGNGTAVQYIYDSVSNLLQNKLYSASSNLASNDFGSVFVGSTSTALTLTISNTGTETYVINAVGLNGNDTSSFSITADTCTGNTLAPSQKCTLQAAFSPLTLGSKNTTIAVLFNSPNTIALTVPLSGKGVNYQVPTSQIALPANGTTQPVGIPLTISGTATDMPYPSRRTYSYSLSGYNNSS